MCPTEIFLRRDRRPFLRLLPIETRIRHETVSALKRQHVEWIKVRLNVESREEMVAAMRHLVEVKTVTVEAARTLGLWDDSDPVAAAMRNGDKIEIPAWRHAMISYPHPLLRNGLVVLDTPGAERARHRARAYDVDDPQCARAAVRACHRHRRHQIRPRSVQKYVQPGATRRIAVLNKIDLMWDDLKTEADIADDIGRQIDQTSALLGLPRSHVMAITAQKALVARVRGDSGLLARSGIAQLEHLLASEIIPAKQEIMRAVVKREIGSMVDGSRPHGREPIGRHAN